MTQPVEETVKRGLFAYPSRPLEIGATIKEVFRQQRSTAGIQGIETWEQVDIAGRFLMDPLFEAIANRPLFFADITRLNFNVTFEIGFAIAKQRRVFLVKNKALKNNDALVQEIGLFDTLSYAEYSNAAELYEIVKKSKEDAPLLFEQTPIKTTAPVFVISPEVKTDAEIRLFSRLRKAKLHFRSYDPQEQGRLAARFAIQEVAKSHGVVVPLLSTAHRNAEIHNTRAAFVAGLAYGMGKVFRILQAGDEPVPLDYRDLVTIYKHLDQIDEAIASFAPEIAERYQQVSGPAPETRASILSAINVGASAAENEMSELGSYYLETDEYRRTLRGEIQVVAGRKGAGKTALFFQARNKLRDQKQFVVLDLKPEGYQLLKFKEEVLARLSEGTREHTVTAFWEYLLLLELCHKILKDDRDVHLHNHKLFAPYRNIANAYEEDRFVKEGDFAERMTTLTQRIAEDFKEILSKSEKTEVIPRDKITGLLYRHDIRQLQEHLFVYLSQKKGVWILFDNLDKGWPPYGVTTQDLLIVRCLLDALSHLKRDLERRSIPCHGVLFIRNDVYEHLVAATPDRGKIAAANIDWSDSDLLRELLRRRLVVGGVGSDGASFQEVWNKVCVSHMEGEESAQYLIDRCLMRPRAFLDLFGACRTHAVNLGHSRIEEEDILQGEESFSSDLVGNIGFEIRDVMPKAAEILYEFIGCADKLKQDELNQLLAKASGFQRELRDLLLWYGFLGYIRSDGEAAYIYSVKYDLRRLIALIDKDDPKNITFCINPAFWRGLEVRSH